jgi:outer membrane protein OmpA-like peptidoglycan-associated protein
MVTRRVLFLGQGNTQEYGLKIGETYANWIADALRELGIPKDKLYVVSYGEEHPIRIGGGEDSDEDLGTLLLNSRVQVTLR